MKEAIKAHLPGEVGEVLKVELSEEELEAYRLVDRMVDRADQQAAYGPMWHGWALREAFLAGVDWAREEDALSNNYEC